MAGSDFGRVTVHDDETFTVELGSGDPVAWYTKAERVETVLVEDVLIKSRYFTNAETIGLEGPRLKVEEVSDRCVNIVKDND